jgi:REP element-mobilizing transposase RayT
MSHYRRVKLSGGTYFFTVNLMDRRAKTLTDNIDLLRNAFAQMRRKHPFYCDAIVILPDHLHAVWTLPAGDCNYSRRGFRGIYRPSQIEHIPNVGNAKKVSGNGGIGNTLSAMMTITVFTCNIAGITL